jgi:hypothetical protein
MGPLLAVAVSLIVTGCGIDATPPIPISQPVLQTTETDDLLQPAAPETQLATARETDPTDEKLLPIGSFRGREHTITIYSASDVPRFTVVARNGDVMAEKLSAEEIQARLPNIFSTYKSTFAQLGEYIDASISPSLPARLESAPNDVEARRSR